MPYATPDDLRARYLRNGADDLALRADEDLAQALGAASREIDSYLPVTDLSDAARAILQDKCLTLARLLIHQNDALDDAHPIVRDGKEVRAWLKLLARGAVTLPGEAGEPITPAGIAAGTRPLVYDAAFAARYALP